MEFQLQVGAVVRREWPLCATHPPKRWTTPDPAKSRKRMGGVGTPLKVSTVWLRKRDALGVPLQ